MTKVTLLEVMLFNEAVIVVPPFVRVDSIPLALIVATVVLLDAQVTWLVMLVMPSV